MTPSNDPRQRWGHRHRPDWAVERWAFSVVRTPRFVVVMFLLAMVSIPLFRWIAHHLRTSPAGEVIFGSVLFAPGEREPRPTGDFDRLNVPSGTTALQLSIPLAEVDSGERFVTEIEAIDDGAAKQPRSTVVEFSPTGVYARVALPLLSDGDYILRVHRLGDANREVVVTRAFRVRRRRRQVRGTAW